MAERLSDLEARIGSVRTLGAVIRAMRGIAAARSRQASAQRAAVDRYATTLAEALGRVLAVLPDRPDPGEAQVTVVFLAEQGFAGAFSEKLLDSLDPAPGPLVLIGTRGAAVARERGLDPAEALPLPAHTPAIPAFADRLAERLLVLSEGAPIDAVHAVSAATGWTVARTRVFPFPATGEPEPAAPPLMNLPPAELLAGLLADCLHAELCRAALHAVAAENTARMLAMAAAQSQTERKLDELQQRERLLRQEAITAEILELAAGEAAAEG